MYDYFKQKIKAKQQLLTQNLRATQNRAYQVTFLETLHISLHWQMVAVPSPTAYLFPS